MLQLPLVAVSFSGVSAVTIPSWMTLAGVQADNGIWPPGGIAADFTITVKPLLHIKVCFQEEGGAYSLKLVTEWNYFSLY